MEIVAGIAGLITGALAAWSLARARAAAELTRFQVQVAERIGYWRDEAQRAKAAAARAGERADGWAAGCRAGREEVLSLARTLAGPRLPVEEADRQQHPGRPPGGHDQDVGPAEGGAEVAGLHAVREVLHREDPRDPQDPVRG